MGLPLVSAVLGLIAGLSLITVLGHVVTVPTIAPTLATMIGLGVGIDYALFLVTRHRDNRRQGMEMHESVAMAVATSGSAIVFAGTTVVIALLALARRRDSAGDVARLFVGRRGRDRRARCSHAAAGGDGDRREAHRVGSACPQPCDPRRRMLDRGFWGGWARALTRRPLVGDPRRARAVDPADRPVPLAEPRPGGHRRHAEVDHRAPGLRPDDRRASASATTARSWSRSTSGARRSRAASTRTSTTQAQSLQKQLEQEQKRGRPSSSSYRRRRTRSRRRATQLTAQQKQLEQQQNSLEAQQAALERQAKADKQEQEQIQASANKLEAEQVALNKQIAGAGAQAKKVVSDGAKTTKKLTSTLKKLTKNQAEQKKVEEQIEHTTDPSQKKKLEAKLSALQKQETKLEKQLDEARPGRPGEPRGIPGPARQRAEPAQAGGQRRQPRDRAGRAGGNARDRRRRAS